MMHILLIILKIIGIVLLAVVGFLLLVLLLALFCPLVYRGKFVKTAERMVGSVSVSWLFRLLWVTASYDNGKRSFRIRLFGIPLDAVVRLLVRRRGRNEKDSEKGQDAEPEQDSEKGQDTEPGQDSEKRHDAELGPDSPKGHDGEPGQDSVKGQDVDLRQNSEKEQDVELGQVSVKDNTGQEEDSHTKKEKNIGCAELRQESKNDKIIKHTESRQGFHGFSRKKRDKRAGSEKNNSRASESKATQERTERKPFFLVRIWRRIVAFFQMLAGLPGRIRQAIRRFFQKSSGILQKISRFREILNSEQFINAFGLMWGSVGKLLLHVRPRKIRGYLRFGFDDPSQTGLCLGAVSVAYPWYHKTLTVEPDFQHKALEADLYLRGRVFGVFALYILIKVYFDKNIKYIINRFRDKEAR